MQQKHATEQENISVNSVVTALEDKEDISVLWDMMQN
jgi:hypothetical protein